MIKFNIKKKNGEVVDIIPILVNDRCAWSMMPFEKENFTKYVETFDWQDEEIADQVSLNLEAVVEVFMKEAKKFLGYSDTLRKVYLLQEYCGRGLKDCIKAMHEEESLGKAAMRVLKIEKPPIVQISFLERENRYPTVEEVLGRLLEEK